MRRLKISNKKCRSAMKTLLNITYYAHKNAGHIYIILLELDNLATKILHFNSLVIVKVESFSSI